MNQIAKNKLLQNQLRKAVKEYVEGVSLSSVSKRYGISKDKIQKLADEFNRECVESKDEKITRLQHQVAYLLKELEAARLQLECYEKAGKRPEVKS